MQLKTFLWTAWCVLENIQRFHLASLDLYFHFIHSDPDLKRFYELFGEGGFKAAKGSFLLFIFQTVLRKASSIFFSGLKRTRTKKI